VSERRDDTDASRARRVSIQAVLPTQWSMSAVAHGPALPVAASIFGKSRPQRSATSRPVQPCVRWGISRLHDVQVIAHDRESQHIDVESLDLGFDALFKPCTTVIGGIATEEPPPHAVTDQVKGPRSSILNDEAAGSGHWKGLQLTHITSMSSSLC